MNEVIDGLPEEEGSIGSLPEPMVQRESPQATILIRRTPSCSIPPPGSSGPRTFWSRTARSTRSPRPVESTSMRRTKGWKSIEAEGFHVFPAFFDPHVHFRTPGQEYKEDLETGTRSAAAGGYAGVLAMANTSPTVSTAEQIESLRDRAAWSLRSRSDSWRRSPTA